jgi:hypothetical protein
MFLKINALRCGVRREEDADRALLRIVLKGSLHLLSFQRVHTAVEEGDPIAAEPLVRKTFL